MIARYAGKCRCGAAFPKGAEIEYYRAARQVISCPTCRKERSTPDYSDTLYEDQCAAACGLDSMSY